MVVSQGIAAVTHRDIMMLVQCRRKNSISWTTERTHAHYGTTYALVAAIVD